MSTLIFNTKYENSEGIGDFECNLPKKLFFVKKKVLLIRSKCTTNM